MKKLLALTLIAICSMNFTTKLQADDNVGEILLGVGQFIENSRRNKQRIQYQPGFGQPPHGHQHPSRTAFLPRTFIFGARTHTGALAIQLKEHANAMCLEAYSNYRHNRAFKAIYADMYEILTEAKHLIHLTNNRHKDIHDKDHIASDLYEIDQLFHRVENGVKGWTSNRRYHNNLPARMESVEDTIHHLMEDYGVKSKIGIGNGNVPVPIPGNQPSNGYGARLHVIKLAMKLNRQSANMCRVAHGHYKRNPAFRAIYRDMYKLMKESQHILELANNNVNDDHIAADLNDIDQLFHKIENGTKQWRSDNSFHADLPQALEDVEETIHHLMEDFGVKSKIGGGNVPVPVPGNVPLPAGSGNNVPLLSP
jgi:hypothetical protein